MGSVDHHLASALHVRTAIICGPALVTFHKVPQPVMACVGHSGESCYNLFLISHICNWYPVIQTVCIGMVFVVWSSGWEPNYGERAERKPPGVWVGRPKSVTRKFPGFPPSNTTLVCTALYSADKYQSRLSWPICLGVNDCPRSGAVQHSQHLFQSIQMEGRLGSKSRNYCSRVT